MKMKKLFSMIALIIVSILFLGVKTVKAESSLVLDLTYYAEVELDLNDTSNPLGVALGSLVDTTVRSSFWTFDDSTLSQGCIGDKIMVTYDSASNKAKIVLNISEPKDGAIVKNVTYNGNTITIKYGYQIQEISEIIVNNANFNLTDGLVPKIKTEEGSVFTAEAVESDKYFVYYESWFNASDSKNFTSTIHWNNMSQAENSLFSKFEGGKTYQYSIWIKPKGGYEFSENVKLVLNGAEYVYDTNRDVMNDDAGVWFNNIKSVTVATTNNTSDYQIIEGANQSYTIESGKSLTLKVNGDFTKFVGIVIDETPIPMENYTAVSGSTIITLKSDFLNTLSSGSHSMKVVYNDGEVTTNFTVAKKEEALNNPQTLDNISWYIMLGSISFIGLLSTGLYLKKKIN